MLHAMVHTSSRSPNELPYVDAIGEWAVRCGSVECHAYSGMCTHIFARRSVLDSMVGCLLCVWGRPPSLVYDVWVHGILTILVLCTCMLDARTY